MQFKVSDRHRKIAKLAQNGTEIVLYRVQWESCPVFTDWFDPVSGPLRGADQQSPDEIVAELRADRA